MIMLLYLYVSELDTNTLVGIKRRICSLDILQKYIKTTKVKTIYLLTY